MRVVGSGSPPLPSPAAGACWAAHHCHATLCNRAHAAATPLLLQLWYGLSQGVAAFINPFLPVYFAQLGFTSAQIGLLSALRPWIAAPCGEARASI